MIRARRRARIASLILACFCAPRAFSDDLPPATEYLGEIRRDAAGKLYVVPARTKVPDAAGPDQVQEPRGKLIQVGADKPLRSIGAAAKVARDGDTVEIDAGDYLGDVAVWTQDNLILRSVGGVARLIANGASAEDKAIWVIRGGRVSVEGIEFTGTRVRDKNGAGIRFEKGRLAIRKCRFIGNENGILTGGGDGELTIENSEFGHNGAGDGYSHNLYVGALRKLTVTGSYFHHANVGHLLKSRARESHIRYNRLTDESGGRASYELEFPNGGVAYVIGNIIEQSETTENPTVVSFGAEGYRGPGNRLYLINNTLIDNRGEAGTFLVARPGFEALRAYNNLLLGKRPLNTGIDGEFVNNPLAGQRDFVLAERQDYRLVRGSRFERTYVSPGETEGRPLAPTHEYVHPTATRILIPSPTLPGARQTLEPDSLAVDIK